jgi:hypothetical protein
MTDPRARVVVDGDVTPLRQALRAGLQNVQQFGDDAATGFGKVNGPLESIRGKFMALTAVLGGGALFSKAIEQTAKFQEESIQLGKSLGISATGASTWIAALEDVGATTDQMSTAGRGLLKHLNEDEGALNKLGLATRDSAGALRPMNELMLDAIKLTGDFKEGTDRDIAASQLFGKGIDASSALLKLNSDTVRENAELMAELGLLVGQEQVDAYNAFDSAGDKAALVMKGFANTIGNVLIPVVTKLAEWFVAVGPTAITVTRGAIGGLTAVFWGLKNAVVVVWEVLNGLVVTVAEPLRALGAGLYKLMSGDLKGAQDELMGWPARIGEAWGKAWDNIVASSTETRDRLAAIFSPDQTEAAPSGGGNRSASLKGKGDKDKDGASSYMSYYEAMLAEEKRVQAVLTEGREYTKEEELAYWRWLTDNLTMTTADQVAIQRKTAQIEVSIAKETRQQRDAIEQDGMRTAEQLALGKIELERVAAKAALDAEEITKAQLAQLEVEFEDRRYVVQASALQQRLQLLSADPTVNPVELARIKNELLLVEQQHEQQRLQVLSAANTALREQGANAFGGAGLFSGIGDSFGTALDGLLQKTSTWGQALGTIFGGVKEAFLRNVVTEPMSQWIASQARMLAMKLGFLTQEKGMQAAASATNVAVKSVEATAVVGANAAEAGSGAAASQASIPVVGPVLAIAAMAAIFAAVSGMGKGIKSASGGYDIPSGLNPITQLHEEEMVLPKQHANVIRQLAGQGGERQGSGDAGPSIELRGVTAGEFFMASKRDLVAVLKALKRDFSLN